MTIIKCNLVALLITLFASVSVFSQGKDVYNGQLQPLEEILFALGKGGYCITGRADMSIGTIGFRLSNGSLEKKNMQPLAMAGWGVVADVGRLVLETQFISVALPQLSSYTLLETRGFATNIGYKVIDQSSWNMYPYIGFGAERIDNENGEITNTSMHVGLGVNYFLPFYSTPTNQRYSMAAGILSNIQLTYQHRFIAGYLPENIDLGGSLTLRLQMGLGIWWVAKRYEDVMRE